MTARAIVERFDVVADLLGCLISVFVDALRDSFVLETAEERLRHRVIPAVAPAAHAGLQVIGFAEASPSIATILRTLIRVNQRTARAPSTHGLRLSVAGPAYAKQTGLVTRSAMLCMPSLIPIALHLRDATGVGWLSLVVSRDGSSSPSMLHAFAKVDTGSVPGLQHTLNLPRGFQSECVADLDELHDVNPSLPRFILCDERLGLAQFRGEILLG